MKAAKLNLLDKVKSYFSPKAASDIAKNRMVVSAVEEMGYLTPGSRKKTMSGTVAHANSPHQDTSKKLEGSRALIRDMSMNTPLAVAALKRTKTNAVGSGLIPQIMPNWRVLGITQEAAKNWAEEVEFRFDTWASSKNADFSGMNNFYDLQVLAFANTILNGDMFYLTPWTRKGKARNWPWELSIKLVEADLVRNPKEELEFITGPDIKDGVEYQDGRVVAYHVANYYKSQYYQGQKETRKFERVKILDNQGRQNIYHLMLLGDRPGQRRGMGLLAPVVDLLKTMTRYQEAYLAGELVSALFTVFIKDSTGLGGGIAEPFTPEDVLGGGGSTIGEEGAITSYEKNQDDQFDLNMGHANILELPEGKEIQFADPKRDPTGFTPFMETITQHLGAALEISSEQLLMAFNTSYTAARAGMLESWKNFKARRIWFARGFTQPILEAFLEEEVSKGRIKAKGFFDDVVKRAAWSMCAWIGPGNGHLDPLKEGKASVMKIQNNLSTHEEEYTIDKGTRWDRAMGIRAQENELLKRLNLYIPTQADLEEVSGPTGTSVVKPADKPAAEKVTENNQKNPDKGTENV